MWPVFQSPGGKGGDLGKQDWGESHVIYGVEAMVYCDVFEMKCC